LWVLVPVLCVFHSSNAKTARSFGEVSHGPPASQQLSKGTDVR
jgi:hypothetical protein